MPNGSPLDLSPYVYGTTRLGHADVAMDQRKSIARAALKTGAWFHTSRQYDDALEVLGSVYDEDRSTVPRTIYKIGGGTIDDVRGTIESNLSVLGLESMEIGQLSPGGRVGEQFAAGGPIIDELLQLKEEGLVGNFLMEVFPWTSSFSVDALRRGDALDLVDAFIFYLNPIQRFASNELWDALTESEVPIISMRTVAGGPVHRLRDVPGAAWQPYIQERAVEVAPIFEESGIDSWTEFCVRFAYGFPNLVTTVGSTSRHENLDEFIAATSGAIEPLPSDIHDAIVILQRRWSDETDIHAEPWSM